ncbi:MAG: hypothetical protein JSU63_13695 [Phycisphaerales bacterium]|nr:MAG: hypothetical protein JSU63_13695 [Phycisphaerales bacterium]
MKSEGRQDAIQGTPDQRRRPSRVLMWALGIAFANITVHAHGEMQPQIIEPPHGATLLITASSLANPPIVLTFTHVADAVSYIVEVSGSSDLSFELTDIAVGEVVVGGIVFPPETTPGIYAIRIQGSDAFGQPIGEFSEPVSLELAVAQAEPFAPGMDVDLSGVVLASSVSISPAVTVTAIDDVRILCLGSVSIEGELVGRDGQSYGDDGASITITAGDGISVWGRIGAGNGALGEDVTVMGAEGEPAVAVGGDAGNGGAVTLLAFGSDVHLGSSSRVATGVGGAGGSATAHAGDGTDVGQDAGNGTADGGAGGNGGDLTIFTPGGTLSVESVVPGLLVSNDGGTGGDVEAIGGDGGDGDADTLPGLGGSCSTAAGRGGDSGNLTLTTLDWDGDGVVTLAEFAVVTGAGGGLAGSAGMSSRGISGKDGYGESIAFRTLRADCDPGPGKTPDPVTNTPKKAGDGWLYPGTGKFARAVGKSGIGSGKGGDAVAKGGAGGNVKRIGLSAGYFGLQYGFVVTGGNGGGADATAGAGGSSGGDGGDAIAEGGKGGSTGIAPGIDQYGGNGATAVATGGNGMKPVSCCDPPKKGLIGGKGGAANAAGGDGGDANNTGGNGGDAFARGGTPGPGGDGEPPGAGGPGGVASPIAGGHGTGFLFNGVDGNVLLDVDPPDGPLGNPCPKRGKCCKPGSGGGEDGGRARNVLDITCIEGITEVECDAFGGVFFGEDATCWPTEACCDMETGDCADIDPDCCEAFGFSPVGGGSVCLGDADPVDGIDDACGEITPAVSTWGMVVIAVLLLIGMTIKFGRRRTVKTT